MKIKTKNEHIVVFSEKEWEDLRQIFYWANQYVVESTIDSSWPESLRKLSEELE